MSNSDDNGVPSRPAAHAHPADLDVVVVGAGFSGLYALKRLREQGLAVRVLEAGDGIGGTWYFNRYPGAHCDIESLDYSYSFSEELQQEWTWSDRYASQPELLAYLEHVADRFDLRRSIDLGTRVVSAHFDEARGVWRVRSDGGAEVTCRYLVMATGVLSVPKDPEVAGLEDFEGDWYHTGHWPKEPVGVAGKRVAIIGTGSSAVQMIPILAEEAEHLLVLQRTPNFTVPANNHPLDPVVQEEWKATYPERRRHARTTYAGHNQPPATTRGVDLTPEERSGQIAHRWAMGGLHVYRAFLDIMTDATINEEVADHIRDRIRATVDDPVVAEQLIPRGLPFGVKRPCSATRYYETFNRDNVTLVDLGAAPLQRVTSRGVRTADGEHEVDVIVFATGFHAMTGALLRVNPVGRDGVALADHWATGPESWMGLMVAGFPNLFTITGPGSPSVISNMVCSIEQHVEWVCDAIAFMEARGGGTLEPELETERAWVRHAEEVAARTLYATADASWYYTDGASGKVFMPYLGGVGPYGQRLADVAERGYEGFAVTPAEEGVPALGPTR